MRESRDDEVAVRQRLTRLRRGPGAGPVRDVVPPLPRTAAAAPALPDVVTTTSVHGAAAALPGLGRGEAAASPGLDWGEAAASPDLGRGAVAASADLMDGEHLRRGEARDRRPSPRPATAESTREPVEVPAVTRPSRFGGASAFDPGRRGTKALALVAVLVVLVAAVIAWRSRPRPEAVVVEPAGSSMGQSSPESSAGAGEVVVAVAGRVRRPGLVRLPAGARVADAIAAAGGAVPGTDDALLNLARKVNDGELILVGVTAPPGSADGAAAWAGGSVAGDGTQGGGKVNLNTATLAQLDALPGVGPVLAQRILDHRERQGPFRAVSDLRQVDGIGDARYEQLKELVEV